MASPRVVLARQPEHELAASQEEQREVEADGDAAADCRPEHEGAGTLGESPRRARSSDPREYWSADVVNNMDVSLPVDGVRQNRRVNEPAQATPPTARPSTPRIGTKRQSDGDRNHRIGD